MKLETVVACVQIVSSNFPSIAGGVVILGTFIGSAFLEFTAEELFTKAKYTISNNIIDFKSVSHEIVKLFHLEE